MSSSRPVSRGMSTASAPDVLEPMHDMLNVADIDLVKENVRAALRGEAEELKEDINMLNACLEREAELQVGRTKPRQQAAVQSERGRVDASCCTCLGY